MRFVPARFAALTCDNGTIRCTVTSAQVRMARAALNWTVRDLAEATGLHRNTITNIEVGRYAGNQESISVIEKVLRDAGVEFIAENGKGPGVRLSQTKIPDARLASWGGPDTGSGRVTCRGRGQK